MREEMICHFESTIGYLDGEVRLGIYPGFTDDEAQEATRRMRTRMENGDWDGRESALMLPPNIHKRFHRDGSPVLEPDMAEFLILTFLAAYAKNASFSIASETGPFMRTKAAIVEPNE